MFKKVLVANRGEIALRILRAWKELNIPTVAIHSEADAITLYVKKADESCLVGPGPVAGYLNIYRIVDLAKQRGADAIHPGYGFLAENAEFARACQENGITFIGPTPKAIAEMGDKIVARQMMKKAGIPVVPGIEHGISSANEAESIAKQIGYPVMLKASAGGGGRGLRLCRAPEDLKKNFEMARSEALKAFGRDDVYIEKYIESPRHIEFQILADHYGNIVHLGERDCSIQRRHQKLIEVAPSPFLDPDLRRRMGEAALTAASTAGYTNAGTVEFLVDKNKDFYFLEMNTRVQVEHTITEEITGIDIVKEMIRIAAGEELSFTQDEVQISGSAIESRAYAEAPRNHFLPTTGRLTAYYSPGGFGVRIDGNVYRGYVVPPYYDSMLAKLTVWGRTWDEAVSRTARSLDEFVIRGVKTTIPFYRMIMRDEVFRRGEFNTHYIENRFDDLIYENKSERIDLVFAIAAAISAHSHR